MMIIEGHETHEISHSLIIRIPWITLILAGLKTWELRTRKTAKRGWIGLIQQGTGQIVGITHLVQVIGPLSLQELELNNAKHCVNLQNPELQKWRCAWILKDAKRIKPVPYLHKQGAIIWVKH